ncbi:type I restriction-modification system subunit M [bacterium]|nr:type I restriction-modification system subunit M [bacterium]
MNSPINQKTVNDQAWKACDSFRGSVDPAEYKNYILTMLFIKYTSDIWKDKRREYAEKYKGDKTRIERALGRERFVVPKAAEFDYLFKKRDVDNIGELINIALEKMEDVNKTKLEGVFRNIDFNSDVNLGLAKERNRRLKNLLEDFGDEEKMDLRPSHIGNRDVIGDVYEYLIERFAAGAGKKAGEFYTPPEVSTLIAELMDPKEGDKICDPACGSGSLLIKVGKHIGSPNYFLAGQESNGSTWALCRMNMFLHDVDNARIEWCDTITNPKLLEKDDLIRFNIVVANPPFSLDKWGIKEAESDPYNRFWRGLPPKSRGDYAFITHMVDIAMEGEGKVGVVVPHGVLFRSGAEGKIRRQFIEENILEAVIGLPSQLFFGTGIPAAIMVFNKGRKSWTKAKTKRDKHILFIDASREFDDNKKQNKLRRQDIKKIIDTYKGFKEIEKYSHLTTLDEIREAEFNLNIPRYVDTFEEEEDIDIKAVQQEIKQIEGELGKTRKEMDKYLKELGLV